MPSTHPRRLHPLLIHLPLLIHFCTPHPTIPLLTNLSLPLPLSPPPSSLSAGRDIECFGPGTPKAHPVDLLDCPYSIDLLYHDPSGVMTLQKFFRAQPVPPHLSPLTSTHKNTTPTTKHTTTNNTTTPTANTPLFPVPSAWQVGGCQVVLTSADDDATDTFRLADVIVKAERIIDECPPKSKKSLGGLATVGHGHSFFVAVNGPDTAPRVEGWEGDGGKV